MKKTIASLTAFILAASFAACGTSGAGDSSPQEGAAAAAETAPEGPFEWQGPLIYSGFTRETVSATDVEEYADEDAIDPAVFYDGEGRMWLVYGSWSGDIFLPELDESTGRVIHPVDDPDNDVDAYFGKRPVGGGHMSMEAPYILWDEEDGYYYLFVSYGAPNRDGGYQIRVFRSDKPDGEYVDMNGQTLASGLNNAYYGLKLSGNYRLPSLASAYKATGHNSALVDDDGRKYVVYHTRFDNGTAKTEMEEGSWTMQEGGYCMTVTIGDKTYSGVFCAMDDEAGTPVMTFSAVGYNESVWGVKYDGAAK